MRCCARIHARTASSDSNSTFDVAKPGIDARQPGERQHEQAADEEHHEPERDLRRPRTDASRRCASADASAAVLSAVIGATLEARSAGAMPKSAVVSERQAGCERQQPPVECEIELHRIVGRCEHADDRRRRRPRRRAVPERTRRRPRARFRSASAESTGPGSAPIERRRDISRSRAAVRARNRLATFEPAMTRTSAAIAARIQSERSN